jgi:hypothetical protein
MAKSNKTELNTPGKIFYFRSLSLSFFEEQPDRLAEAFIFSCRLKHGRDQGKYFSSRVKEP